MIQAKVLRILEEKEIVRLGETKPVKVDVRIISATNKDLKVEMEGGRFRQDLYYRLTALCFNIPPLRDRREDIPLPLSTGPAMSANWKTRLKNWFCLPGKTGWSMWSCFRVRFLNRTEPPMSWN